MDTGRSNNTDIDIHANACDRNERQCAFEDYRDSVENAGLIGDGICQCVSTLLNSVNSVVTDKQTITKEMKAVDLDQNFSNYD